MKTPRLTLGTRASRLALIQSEMVRKAILTLRPDLEGHIDIATFNTRGDERRDCAIESLGGRGAFTDTLDQAVADGRVDLAVHSVKDLPVPLPRGLVLAAMLEREDAREAFVSSRHARLDLVPDYGVMGSASMRREALVRALRPALKFSLLRGNVDERVAAVEAGSLDGTILAVAGLKRLGLQHHIRQIFTADELMPDPGQGAIGVVCRSDHLVARTLAARINHLPTFQAVLAERAFLGAAGGRFIVGALAVVANAQLQLSAVAAGVSGAIEWRGSIQGAADEPVATAQRLATLLPVSAALGELS